MRRHYCRQSPVHGTASYKADNSPQRVWRIAEQYIPRMRHTCNSRLPRFFRQARRWVAIVLVRGRTREFVRLLLLFTAWKSKTDQCVGHLWARNNDKDHWWKRISLLSSSSLYEDDTMCVDVIAQRILRLLGTLRVARHYFWQGHFLADWSFTPTTTTTTVALAGWIG